MCEVYNVNIKRKGQSLHSITEEVKTKSHKEWEAELKLNVGTSNCSHRMDVPSAGKNEDPVTEM